MSHIVLLQYQSLLLLHREERHETVEDLAETSPKVVSVHYWPINDDLETRQNIVVRNDGKLLGRPAVVAHQQNDEFHHVVVIAHLHNCFMQSLEGLFEIYGRGDLRI